MARPRRNSNTYTIRTVRTKEDRRRPSVFMRLKTDEAFKGVALFEPDPELEDNPGYYEYYDHYDKQGNAYVPCTGDRCPFCAANDNPSTRAMTVWYLPQEGNKGDQIKVFTMNFSTTQDMTDEAEEEGGLLGKTVRVKRLSDKGDYRVRITNDKKLTKAELKEVMGQVEEKFPDGLEGLVQRQLSIQMERLKALDAMDDDEEDEDEEREERTTTRARRGRVAAASSNGGGDDEEDEDGEEEDGEEGTTSVEEQEFELLSVSKRKNSVTVEIDGEESELVGDEDEIDVSDFRKGDVAVVSAEWDDEEESWVLTAIEAAEEAEEGDEEAEEGDEEDENEEGEEEGEEEDSNSVEGGSFEVVRVEEEDEILHLKSDDGTKFKMWVGEGVNPDYDTIKKGVTVVLDAQTDEEGDWIVTSVKVKPQRQARTRKTTTARKTTARSRKR